MKPSVIWLACATTLAASPAHAAIEAQQVPRPAESEAQPPAAPQLTRAPELVTFVSADYPPDLLAQGLAGEVVLYIDIDGRGAVEHVEVFSSSAPAFAEAALTAVTQFVFSPAEIDNVPAPIRIEYRYGFTPEAPTPDGAATAESTPAEAPMNWKGLVREAGVRTPIAGAVIAIDEQNVAETNAEGSFAVRGAPAGKHKVKITSRLHDTYEVEEEFSDTERLEAKYYLVRRARDPFETVVRGRIEKREVAKVQLERREVTKMPGTFGDPVRVIENMPGLARVPGGLGGALLVRGSQPADTAVFIDGVPVPLLYHFGGLTSVVNAQFLERIDFFPGGFGARYGRATAGIVDVVSRDLDCQMVRGAGEVSVMLASAYLCAPLGEWAVAAAGRRSYIDFFLPFVLDRIPRAEGQGRLTVSPVFWDYQTKARLRTGAHTLEIFAFGSDDRLRLVQSGSAEDVNIGVGMHMNSHRLLLRDRYKPTAALTITSSIAPGRVVQEFDIGAGDSSFNLGMKIDITGANWREDVSYKLSDMFTVNGGLDHDLGQATLDFNMPVPTDLHMFPAPVFDYTQSQPWTSTMKGASQGYWLEGVLTPGAGLTLVPGLRLDYFSLHKTQALALQPRLTARFEVHPGTTAKAAYGWYEKLPEEQYLIDSMGNPKLKPLRAQQFIAGLEQTLTDLINVDVQGFYTKRERLVSLSTRTVFADGKERPEYYNNDGSGRSYGLEVLLRHLARQDSNFYGWIAYTLSRSLVRDHPGELEYPFAYDQTHILTVVGQWILPWGLEAGFRFRLVSGNPYTPTDAGVVSFDADLDRYAVDIGNVALNSSRMPNFEQLDVRIDKTWTFDLWTLGLFLEVINATNAKNVEGYSYDYRYRSKNATTLLPILPTIGVKGEF